MEVLILGICHEIFFGKKRSKIRVRIILRRALYTGKYGSFVLLPHAELFVQGGCVR